MYWLTKLVLLHGCIPLSQRRVTQSLEAAPETSPASRIPRTQRGSLRHFCDVMMLYDGKATTTLSDSGIRIMCQPEENGLGQVATVGPVSRMPRLVGRE